MHHSTQHLVIFGFPFVFICCVISALRPGYYAKNAPVAYHDHWPYTEHGGPCGRWQGPECTSVGHPEIRGIGTGCDHLRKTRTTAHMPKHPASSLSSLLKFWGSLSPSWSQKLEVSFLESSHCSLLDHPFNLQQAAVSWMMERKTMAEKPDPGEAGMASPRAPDSEMAAVTLQLKPYSKLTGCSRSANYRDGKTVHIRKACAGLRSESLCKQHCITPWDSISLTSSLWDFKKRSWSVSFYQFMSSSLAYSHQAAAAAPRCCFGMPTAKQHVTPSNALTWQQVVGAKLNRLTQSCKNRGPTVA